MSEQSDAHVPEWTPEVPASVNAPTVVDLPGVDLDDVDELNELFVYQRQNHAVEVGVLEKRVAHATQEAKRAREREDLAKWELERIRHANRGELRFHAGRIADLLARNERLEALRALPWWAVIRRWSLCRSLESIL
jgi:hypothetical protein